MNTKLFRLASLPSTLAALALAATPMLSAPAAHAETAGKICPAVSTAPKVFGIGGSTMGSVLGPMLDKVYEEEGVDFSRWGKASSGLARPDFHDWPKEAPRLMAKHKPDIVIVSLGTNDYQALHTDSGPIRQDDPRWEQVYGERVDAMLRGLTADNKERLIIWSGPYAFEGKNAVVRAPIVNRIMRERVEAFAKAGGRAIFHDAYGPTSDDKGRPLSETLLPGKGKKEKIRAKDNIHLTTDAVRLLLAKPIVELTRPCFKTAKAP
jgi:hypothetical protein